VVYLDLGQNFDSGKAEIEQTIFELGGAYAVKDDFEVLFGARLNDVDVEIDRFGGPVIPAIRVEGAQTWTDPFIGGRWNPRMNDRWSFQGRADIGGFGVGSDLTWNAALTLLYEKSDKLTFGFGYRVMDIDYEDGEAGNARIRLRRPDAGAIARRWVQFLDPYRRAEGRTMKKTSPIVSTLMLFAVVSLSCGPVEEKAPEPEAAAPMVAESGDLPEAQYVGYRVVHHMTAQTNHVEEFGFNTFEHPPIANHTFFVITPALDHFYSKAVADLRFGPVVIETPPKDDRYSSLEIFDMEHFAFFDKVTAPEGEKFVLAHVDYEGDLPEGQEIRTNSIFPFVFIRTQSFAFNDDTKADEIRRQAKITGATGPIELPDVNDTQGLLAWTIENSNPYPQTQALMAEAAESYTPELHKETFEDLKSFLASGGVSGNVGMFEAVDHPAAGSHKVRAAGTLLGHLGFPVQHAYYQQIPVDETGQRLAGANGPFVVTLPYEPGVDLFWSVTRYGADTFLPLNPADLGGNDIQAYNAYNTEPDENGNVTFTFSVEDPEDGTYWMPVKDDGYYWLARYYGPTPRLNGNTAKDIIYGGTALEKKFATVKF
jgi:hypothetical protein